MQEQITAMATMHQNFVAQQAAIHEQFLAVRASSLDLLSHVGTTQSAVLGRR